VFQIAKSVLFSLTWPRPRADVSRTERHTRQMRPQGSFELQYFGWVCSGFLSQSLQVKDFISLTVYPA